MKLNRLAALALPLWTTVAQELDNHEWKHKCPQLRPLVPKNSKGISGLDEYLESDDFLQTSVARLSGAVQIDTTSQTWWQDLPGKEPVWEHMSQFRKYLKITFPLIHRHLGLELVNTHGLVYTWKGSNPSLKPSLFMAHQDVVPVQTETLSEWTHPPFSGFFDGKYVWGRGSIDCKTTLIASMSAVESLLKFGYTPQRTLILAFGFDEEISGFQGAQRIAEHLAERYGNDGIALLIDEGPGMAHHKDFGAIYAVPGLAEKGIFNANITVHMESGHSSLSAGYNSITVMAALVSKINDNQLHGQIQAGDLFLQTLFCMGQHVPELPKPYVKVIEDFDRNETLINDDYLPALTEMMPALKPLVDNTQALTMIQGGDKINVIPERTTLSINYRLHLGTSVEQTMTHLEHIVRDYVVDISAAEGGPKLTLRGWSEEETVNSIKLTALPGSLEASPVTSFSVDGTTPYSVLQGTIRSVYDHQGDLTMVAPITMPANTDSRHFWNLTKHIFRFNPGHDMTDASDNQIDSNAHNNNERANIVGHINGVKWYSMFIRNMDEAELA